MLPFRKAFLFLVGAVAIAVEEAGKSIEEATQAIEEQRQKLMRNQHPTEPIV